MKEYHTKQRLLILDVIRKNPKKRFTANEIAESVQESGINKSTVYRNLDRMVNDGEVVRELSGDGSCAVYHLNELSSCEGHIHLICSKCKGVIHLEEGIGSQMASLLQQSCGFSVSNDKTFIAGLCKNCTR